MNKAYDNRGFSLVEIIIVVAIMSVLTATVSYGLSLSGGKPAEECARKLTSELQAARTATMGKYAIKLQLKNDGANGIVLTKDVYTDASNYTPTEVAVGASGVKVEYDSGSGYTELTSGSAISFEFSRSTGALKPIVSGGSSYYSSFKISKANKTMYIKIVPLTGKISVSSTP